MSSTTSTSNAIITSSNDLILRPPLLSHSKISEEHDNVVRKMICRLLTACETLRLGMETRFSAVVLWHRYSVAVNDKDINPNDKAWAAAACLFLACKSEEEPRRFRDIINVCQMYLMEPDQCTTSNTPNTPSTKDVEDQTNSQQSPTLHIHVQRTPPLLDEDYWKSKEILVRAEQTVLRWLGFDVLVSKPHRAVCALLQDSQLEEIVLQRQQASYQEIVPIAWKYLNQSLFYAKALQHSVLALAAAAVDLAVSKGNGSTKELSGPWWLKLEISGREFQAAKKDLHIAKSTTIGETMGHE